MIRIVPYAPEHSDQIKPKPIFDPIAEIKGCAVTFLGPAEPIAIVGWFMVNKTTVQCWAITSEEVRKHPLSFHKSVKLILDYETENLGANRVQMSVKRGYDEGYKWAKSLGFKCEGVMQKYGPDGSDYWLFARVA